MAEGGLIADDEGVVGPDIIKIDDGIGLFGGERGGAGGIHAG